MPNVVRGDRMSGLLVYLAGPGRHNEHEEPHLVSGDASLMAWYRDVELDRGAALAIAHHLDRPRKVFGTEVTVGTYERRKVGRATDGQPKYQSVRTGEKGAHVWHCSLSLRADEGQLSDEKWGQITDDFIQEMGFDDHEGTKAACRWVAVRHGVSGDGNDHVHLAVSLVREDGTKASTHKDFYRAQQAARALEVVYGLERLESSVSTEPSAARGFSPAEQATAVQAATRAGRSREDSRSGAGAWDGLDPAVRRVRVGEQWRLHLPKEALGRKVRGCATAASDEAEFVRRLRGAGLLVRPRFAEGTQDVITGFSVAERPARGVRPVWYGGGRLARDLTLVRLRVDSGWPDDPAVAAGAAAEWNAAHRGRRINHPGRETTVVAPQMWLQHTAELARLRKQLAVVPVDNREVWPQVARQAAGVLSAWSTQVEDTPGHLAWAADALSRSAQTYRRQVAPGPRMRESFAGMALLVSAASRMGQGPVGQAAMVHELAGLCRAVAGVVEQGHQTRQAAQLHLVARANLDRIHGRLQAYEHRAAEQNAAGWRTAAANLKLPESARPEPRQPESGRSESGQPVLDPELAAMVARVRAGQTDPRLAARPPLPNPIEQPRRTKTTSTDKDANRGIER